MSWLRRFALSIAIVVTFAVCTQADDEQHLKALIENVRRAEALYSEIDVKFTTSYRIAREAIYENEYTEMSTTNHYVSQDRMFRLDRDGYGTNAGGKVSWDRIRAYDGKQTQVFEQRAIGNISPERIVDHAYMGPHVFALGKNHPGVSLSAVLTGTAAVLAESDPQSPPTLDYSTKYAGQETIDGLLCEKVVSSQYPKDSDQCALRDELWLAVERGYIPILRRHYRIHVSADIPFAIVRLDDIREIAPGIWFPHQIEESTYNNTALQERKEQVPNWTNLTTIESVSLSPQYPPEHFRDVDFPDGTVMYEVVQGEIKKSWIIGAPEAPGEPVATRPANHRRWFAIILNVVAIVFVYVLYRRRLRN